MAYFKKIRVGGNIMLVEKYHTYRYGHKNVLRGANINKTTEKQKKINARHAAMNRMLKACENFPPGSLFIRLSYFHGERPEGIDAAHKNLCKLMKKIKRVDKDLMYSGVTELGSKGGLHHHLLVPKDFDLNLLKKYWCGGYDIRASYTGELSQLASYLTKGECDDMIDNPYEHNEVEKRYTASRNLKKPYEDKELIKKSEHWTDTPRSITFNGKIYDFKKGSDYNGFTEDGYEYQRYIMIERKMRE